MFSVALAVAQDLRPASLPVRKYGDSVLPGLSSRDPRVAGDRAVAVLLLECKNKQKKAIYKGSSETTDEQTMFRTNNQQNKDIQ